MSRLLRTNWEAQRLQQTSLRSLLTLDGKCGVN